MPGTGRNLFFCGNGGSASDAQHLAAELVGRFKYNRSAIPAIALNVDTSIITAISNDFGYEEVFARQIQALGKRNDVLFAISTSGKSKNILKACTEARERGMKVIGFTGAQANELESICDVTLKIPTSETSHIQEGHIAVGQLVCGYLEALIITKD